MSFPTNTYTSGSAAVSDFLNRAAANGLSPSISLDANAMVFAVLSNMFESLPNTTAAARSAVVAAAGNVPANVSFVELANETEAAYAAVLVAPAASEYGVLKVIAMGENDTDAVTVDVTDVIGVPDSHTLATFDADGETLVLVGAPAGWLYVASSGVALSTPD
jgi:hypothetical protein